MNEQEQMTRRLEDTAWSKEQSSGGAGSTETENAQDKGYLRKIAHAQRQAYIRVRAGAGGLIGRADTGYYSALPG